jgi:hypothetical protein
MKVTAHFTASELTTTSTGLENEPTTNEIWCNLTRLCCTVLEPLRALVGPLRVNSGYRSEAVNAAVGGSNNSAHLSGRAADIVPLTAGETALDLILTLEESLIDFDKAILEYRGNQPWLHVQVRDASRENRRILLMSLEAGEFVPFDEIDPRLDEWRNG